MAYRKQAGIACYGYPDRAELGVVKDGNSTM